MRARCSSTRRARASFSIQSRAASVSRRAVRASGTLPGATLGAPQQQQVFQGAGLDGPVSVLAESDQSALDNLGEWPRPSGVAVGAVSGSQSWRVQSLRSCFLSRAAARAMSWVAVRAMSGAVAAAMTRRGRRLADHGHPGEVEEIGRGRVRVDEEGAAPRLVPMPRQQRGAEAVEHGLAGMQPDDVGSIRRPVDREPAVSTGGMDLHGGDHRIEAAPAFRGEVEDAVGIAVDAKIDQRCRGGDEPADVAGQQPAVPFLVHGRLQRGQAALDAAAPEQ